MKTKAILDLFFGGIVVEIEILQKKQVIKPENGIERRLASFTPIAPWVATNVSRIDERAPIDDVAQL